MTIPTWRERLGPVDDITVAVFSNGITKAMQAELDAYKAALATIENDTIERCSACRSVVPILPGEIPQEMFDSLQGDKDACAEAFRICVRQTLDEYEAAIRMLKKDGVDARRQAQRDSEMRKLKWAIGRASRSRHE